MPNAIAKGATFTYLGHSTFLIRTSEGKTILIDPWLKENPSCPESHKNLEKLGQVDIMLITHGHFDHMADAVAVGLSYQPQTFSNYEICSWLATKGLKNVQHMNKGGGMNVPGAEKIHVTLTHALHSSSIQDGNHTVYGGEAGSFVVKLESGATFFHAGDTCVFGDMKLIGELYKPEVALVPIGDRFTMSPHEAALACKLLNVARVVPMHYATFPLLTGTPAQLKEALSGTKTEVVVLRPGESA